MNVAAPSLYKGDLVQGGTATTEIPGGLGRYGEQLPSTRAQVNIPRFASIKQLDERLSSINNQLSGAYDKEGVAQQNALSQTDKIALRAEGRVAHPLFFISNLTRQWVPHPSQSPVLAKRRVGIHGVMVTTPSMPSA